jgi:hypothetical protein
VNHAPQRPPVSGWQKAAPIIAGCSFLLAAFAAYPVHQAGDRKNEIKIEVTEQLKDPLKQIQGMANDVAEIKGKLETLSANSGRDYQADAPCREAFSSSCKSLSGFSQERKCQN